MTLSASKTLVRGSATICAGILLAISGVSAANAVTVYPPEGGVWTHSAGTHWVESIYKHNARTHKSTACNASSCNYSGWKSPGVTAIALREVSLTGNTAYYDVY